MSVVQSFIGKHKLSEWRKYWVSGGGVTISWRFTTYYDDTDNCAIYFDSKNGGPSQTRTGDLTIMSRML